MPAACRRAPAARTLAGATALLAAAVPGAVAGAQGTGTIGATATVLAHAPVVRGHWFATPSGVRADGGELHARLDLPARGDYVVTVRALDDAGGGGRPSVRAVDGRSRLLGAAPVVAARGRTDAARVLSLTLRPGERAARVLVHVSAVGADAAASYAVIAEVPARPAAPDVRTARAGAPASRR